MAEQTISLECGEFCAMLSFKRVKYARIRILKSCEVRVSVPSFWSKKRAIDFVLEHKEWISNSLRKLKATQLKPGEVQILGKIYTLKFKKISKNEILCESKILREISENFGGKIKISGSEILCKDEKSYQKFKKFIAKNLYEKLIKFYLPHIGKPVHRMVVREMDTRWGSCNSTKGYINLALNLIERNQSFVEYVVLHELAHLIFPHHRREFYDFIAGIMPDYKARATGHTR